MSEGPYTVERNAVFNEWRVVFSGLPRLTFASEEEWVAIRVCESLNAAFAAGRAAGEGAEPVAYLSRDYDRLYEHLKARGEALGTMMGYIERVAVHIKPIWLNLGNKEHFLAECQRLQLEWVSPPERERPDNSELVEAAGVALGCIREIRSLAGAHLADMVLASDPNVATIRKISGQAEHELAAALSKTTQE